jgi:hypothetical protein
VLALACATTRIGDPDEYEPVSLNRVFPYPSDEELAEQSIEVELSACYTDELPESEVGEAAAAVQSDLERYLREAGATVIDPDNGGSSENGSVDADWGLVTRITRFEHFSEFAGPTSLFKSAEELTDKPGTCTHHGEVEFEIGAFKAPVKDVPRTTLRLKNSDDFSEKQFDDSCPISPARQHSLLEDALREAIPCLQIPIKNRLAPRGYVLEQRVSPAGDKHIYRTSLGERNGAESGLELSILRVQYMTTSDGRKTRDERKIGKAVITDEIGDDYSWISVKPRDPDQPVLAGDLVRGVYADSLVSGLGLGKCRRILTIEGER